MKQKPNGKMLITINLVNNIPMAVVMSLTAPLLMRIPLIFSNVMINIVLAFVLACVINLVIPVPLIAEGFPKLFKTDSQSIAGRLLGNLPVSLIFVMIIGLILNLFNVREFPAFLFAFLESFLPLYVVCFAVSMITNPIAMRLAFGSERK